MKVLAALSGGVDSAVAASRMVEQGHDVTAVHLALARTHDGQVGSRGCCTPSDARDAKRVADVLGIPYYVWDFSERFKAEVMDDFVAEYASGHTPNPCVRCNENIKFAAVLERGLALGFDAIATGHHAQLKVENNVKQLYRSIDSAKDQSYVLSVLTAEQLQHSMFPLGDVTKSQVRAEAAAKGLLVAEKPESYDICFIPDNDTAGWLNKQIQAKSGKVVDAETGEELTVHAGAHQFTVGQRRGLHLDRPAADGQPRYVVNVDTKTQTVFVGPETLLSVTKIYADRPKWTCGKAPQIGAKVMVQLRAHGEPLAGTVMQADDEIVIQLDNQTRSVAPGQTLALYDGDRVIGSGTITKSSR
ncbi:MAG: tRNA 2-thiouridine(34) synthase MnmA [Actinomycetota bacterium]|jgi:tRNA-specific 2-thiouridylase